VKSSFIFAVTFSLDRTKPKHTYTFCEMRVRIAHPASREAFHRKLFCKIGAGRTRLYLNVRKRAVIRNQ